MIELPSNSTHPPDDGSEEDYLGNAIAAENVIVNVYTVGDHDGEGVSSLLCQGYDSTSESWLVSVPPPTIDGPQPIVDGVDNMQVLYGVAGSAATPLSVTKYVSGDDLSAADYPNLRSVRVALLVSNGNAAAFAEARTRTYRLLDSELIVITDRQPRRIYSSTVKFNNYNVL